MASTKPDVRFVFKTTYTHDSFSKTTRFHADVVHVVEPDTAHYTDDAGVRNPGTWDDANLAALHALAITAHFTHDKTPDAGWYGWEVTYRDVFCVDLRQAERMVKLLRKIDKGLAKLDEQFGRPHDLAAYCGRVARVLGATSSRPFGQYFRELQMNGTHYRWTDVDGLRYRLEEAVKEHADA